jgi:hypothetical protein
VELKEGVVDVAGVDVQGPRARVVVGALIGGPSDEAGVLVDVRDLGIAPPRGLGGVGVLE